MPCIYGPYPAGQLRNLSDKRERIDSETPGPRPGERFTADVSDLTAEGAGVARHGGLVVFVPGAVPGDLVRARIVRLRRGWAEGELLAVERPADARRMAPCAAQDECGGCPLMVLDEAAALAVKGRALAETLRRVGGVACGVAEIAPSPRPLRYRGRVRFAVAPRGEGAQVGFHPRGQECGFAPVDDCLLAPEGTTALAREFLERLAALGPGPWPAQLEVRCSFASGRRLLVVHGPSAPWPHAAAAAGALLAARPDLAGVVRLVPRRGAPPLEQLLGGAEAVLETIGGAEVELGATSFLQVNPAAAELLYARARAALEGPKGGRLLDLYCGVGLIGLLAVDADVEVVGVELNEAAAERAARAARRAGRTNARHVAADAVAFAREAAERGERFERVALNPPREGAGPGLAAAVAALRPEVVAVVSCHPAALARDLKLFAARGYHTTRVVAVDMFPQTPHLEAVARLEREG